MERLQLLKDARAGASVAGQSACPPPQDASQAQHDVFAEVVCSTCDNLPHERGLSRPRIRPTTEYN